ncbi:hypothetical protein FM037_27930 [Shewanella psychropiezotolerans]|uniref:Uncharacterized protein n=1 Tax=Shewanella psychropiezotolerans TaxID=2593655 RepID=A0ABX5X640_9GAMM|nr:MULTISPECIES: hypothetical protein [Shewanella]MPY25623.1 hypothetical protein [Shewanella sp. YLB-07]QDO86403.1 hypothetical protein FM037_27930 [Shewanella psychropiezotolerans]
MSKSNKHLVMSLSYLGISWALLFWLHFSTEPNIFAHLVAIPSLLMFTGYSAYQIIKKGT